MVNEDCARDLLQYLDSCLEISSTGKRVKPIKLKKVLHEEPLSNYNPTTWEKLKSHFPSVFNAAISSISSFILQAGIELLK